MKLVEFVSESPNGETCMNKVKGGPRYKMSELWSLDKELVSTLNFMYCGCIWLMIARHLNNLNMGYRYVRYKYTSYILPYFCI